MTQPEFTISVSNVCIYNKEEALEHISSVWKTMYPYTIKLKDLKKIIEGSHPFLCCKRKNEWNGQQLFCIDIDHFNPPAGMDFKTFISVLDDLGLPPCIAYTTFGNPDRKRERFRLLFILSEPITELEKAKSVLRLLYNVINELIPGAPDYQCLQPYHLFFPGKKILLYRPKKILRAGYIKDVIQSLKNPYLILDTVRVWNQMKQILEKDPFIPGITFLKPPPGLLIILGSSEKPKDIEYLKLFYTISSDKFTIPLRNINGLCYTLIGIVRIIDYNNLTYKAVECTNDTQLAQSLSVFEHSGRQFGLLLSKCIRSRNCDKKQKWDLFQLHEKTISEAMQIQIRLNQLGIIPARLAQYAKHVLDLSDYPNLQRLFQREPRKQKLLSAVLLCIRDRCLEITKEFPSHYTLQCTVPHSLIADKYRKRFKKSISKDSIQHWMRQLHDLNLIHICSEEEIVKPLQKNRLCIYRRPTVLTVPYYDKSILQHADNLAKDYMPPIKKAAGDDMNYWTCINILSVLLRTHGYFTRDSFIQCIRQEAALDNTDGFTEKNAATYFDKYIPQIQQELHVIKSPCTKQLKARFGGNLKVGSTRVYYRNEETE